MADTRTRLSTKTTVNTGLSKLVGIEADGDVVLGTLAAMKVLLGITGDFVGTSGAKTILELTTTNAKINAGVTIVATDADFTLTYPTSDEVIRHTGTLTTNRTITLAGGVEGSTFKVTRTGSGAFNLSVGGLKNLIQNTWCVVRYDGTNWTLEAYGAL